MPTARASVTAALLSTLLAAGCGGGTGGEGGQTSTATHASVCASDPSAMDYAPGMEQSAADGKIKITLVSAAPAPPAKGGNVFVIDVADEGGQPVSGASIDVKSFMPAHGHSATVVPTVKAGSQPGRYDVSGVELFMLGLWQITFTVTPAGGAAEPVVFSFCIEG